MLKRKAAILSRFSHFQGKFFSIDLIDAKRQKSYTDRT